MTRLAENAPAILGSTLTRSIAVRFNTQGEGAHGENRGRNEAFLTASELLSVWLLMAFRLNNRELGRQLFLVTACLNS